jgi:adenylate cyclase
MPHLIAQGLSPQDKWERELPVDRPQVIGRDENTWAVSWDPFISRRHAEITWREGKLDVRQLPEARNPIFSQGSESRSFRVQPSEQFVIGRTTFTVLQEPRPENGYLIEERTFSDHALQQLKFHDAPHRLDILERLPEVISGADNDKELFARLVNMLLAGIAGADAACLVCVTEAAADQPVVHVLHGDRRSSIEGEFQPSRRLVIKAVCRERQSVLHLTGKGAVQDGDQVTLGDTFDWAFCTPVVDESCPGWGLYVAGRLRGDDTSPTVRDWGTAELHYDLKFTQIVSTILGALRRAQRLQRQQAALGHFFSPAVLRKLTDGGSDNLRPEETEVSVLFCDLRGFSRQSEKSAAALMALLERVSRALGVMTQNIFESGGVIGDFQGDAAMGFWGWPVHQTDLAARACRAALGIRRAFRAAASDPDHPLFGFEVGIGIATGTAVAGSIGTADQVKMTVFGPVVNLASRLEGMTKITKAPILVDENTARLMKEQLPGGAARWRRVAKVKPLGLEASLVVTELVPPAADRPELTDAHLATYEAAVDALLEGRWPEAYERLKKMPPGDHVPDFLTQIILENERKPPPDWDGVIKLKSKR